MAIYEERIDDPVASFYPKTKTATPTTLDEEKHEQETCAWRFVEKYYPKYHSSDEIGHADTLQKILDDEYDPEDEDDTAGQHFNEVRRNTDTDRQALAEIQREYNELHEDIYRRAIEAFLEQQPKPVTKTFIFGKQASALVEQGKTPDEVSKMIADGQVIGSVIETTFPNEDALRWYREGIEDADGWETYLIQPL